MMGQRVRKSRKVCEIRQRSGALGNGRNLMMMLVMIRLMIMMIMIVMILAGMVGRRRGEMAGVGGGSAQEAQHAHRVGILIVEGRNYVDA